MIKNFYFILKDLFYLIKDYKKKNLLIILIFFTILSALFEILSIGSLIPLMEVLINPNDYIKETEFVFKNISSFFGVNDLRKTILICFTLLIIFSYLFKILILWFGAFLTNDISLYLNNNIFKKTIAKKFEYFVYSHTSLLISNQEKIEHVRGIVFSAIQLIVSSVLASSIGIFLFYLNFNIALIVCTSAVTSYYFIYLKVKKKLNYISQEHVLTLNERLKFLIESSENIKEIKLRNLKSFFEKKFNLINIRIKKFKILSSLIGSIPGQIVLLFATLILLAIIYYYSLSAEGLVNNVPFLAALVLALQRIFPQVQNIFVALSGMKSYRNSLIDLRKIKNENNQILNSEIQTEKNKPITIQNNFELKNISFKHFSEKENLFENANLKFELNNMYGIQGESGLGKTSIVDVITGLLKASVDMYVDGNKINLFENSSWQENIAHLPQNTLLTDTTILENIAYGEKFENISHKNVEEAAKKANIYDFIKKTEKGFLTTIGEKGVRISGGQRQRISIAKLFYLNKKIMILDEATNALDATNEEKIYKSLKENIRNKIVIVICHNLKMNKYFDYIYQLKDKKFLIKDQKIR